MTSYKTYMALILSVGIVSVAATMFIVLEDPYSNTKKLQVQNF